MMTNFTPARDLPSLRQLNRATLIAAGVAAVLLVTTVMPAEYGVDPTGIGRLTGLVDMGMVKQAEARAENVVPETQSVASAASAVPGKPVTVQITLQPQQGREVKAVMKAGGEFRYNWKTDEHPVRYELHGEEAGATGDDYTSYEKGASIGESGTFRAPFDGTHGWYWKNHNTVPVSITVTATGEFSSFAARP